MSDDAIMRWSRTDTNEDFDPKLLSLERIFPLSGKGFYTKVRNLIYYTARSAHKPFTINQETWQLVQVVMHDIPRPKFDKYLAACLQLGLFDRELYDSTGEISSERIRREITQRFGDMERKESEYLRRKSGESLENATHNNTRHYKTRRRQLQGSSTSPNGQDRYSGGRYQQLVQTGIEGGD